MSLELSITVCFGKVGPMGLFDKSAHLWFEALFWYAAYCLKHYFGMQHTVDPGRLPFLDAMFSKWTVTSNFCPISFGFLNGLQLLLILHLVYSFWSESLRYKQYESQVYRVLDLYSFIYIIHLRKLLNFYNF